MTNFTILYDEPQEAEWFRSLHHAFFIAREASISEARDWPAVQQVLAYDRPDIILLDGDKPILVIEETVEVPSGHNVGQRFPRIAAAAEAGVPCVYFCPYVAKKHGGETAGPRYMNVRLFKALDAMEHATGTAVTTINWPVDAHFEVRRDVDKDADVKEYVATFLNLYAQARGDLRRVNLALIASPIHARLIEERKRFVETQIRRVAQYDSPPGSVELLTPAEFGGRFGGLAVFGGASEVVLYNVGMTYIRSDPYTGMGILYKYLYISTAPSRVLVFWFPSISIATWQEATLRRSRKDVRLFKVAADAILFSDGLLMKSQL